MHEQTVPRRVLFVCTGNAARSQMAEGLLRHFGGDRYDVWSAGTIPWRLHPLAVQALAEIGIDISAQRSKSVAGLADQPWDVVVTVCDSAREACPIFSQAREQLHWSVADPSFAPGGDEDRLDAFRRTREDLRARIERQFLDAISSFRSAGSPRPS